jgi:hypothetical protein
MTSHEATATDAASGNGSPPDSAGPARKTSWAGVAPLSVGVFALVMEEFLPASLLSRVAADLGVTEGMAGQSVAITAIGAAILADGAGVQTALVLGGLVSVLGALILVAIKPPKLVQL